MRRWGQKQTSSSPLDQLVSERKHRWRRRVFIIDLCAQRLERCTNVGNKERRLLPSREVAAFRKLVEVDEFGKSLLHPTARSCIDLLRVDAHGYRDLDVFGCEKRQFVFPVETSRRDPVFVNQ